MGRGVGGGGQSASIIQVGKGWHVGLVVKHYARSEFESHCGWGRGTVCYNQTG